MLAESRGFGKVERLGQSQAVIDSRTRRIWTYADLVRDTASIRGAPESDRHDCRSSRFAVATRRRSFPNATLHCAFVGRQTIFAGDAAGHVHSRLSKNRPVSRSNFFAPDLPQSFNEFRPPTRLICPAARYPDSGTGLHARSGKVLQPMNEMPQEATGPRTPEGKSISARNATKHGLFTARDYVLPGEEEEYDLDQTALMFELSPEGILEQVFADEIMTASWRLRRCRIIEASFTGAPDSGPASNEDLQRSVDRARAASHNIIRKSTAELRRLQTERAIRTQLGTAGETPGLADTRQIHIALNSAPFDDDDEPGSGPTESRPKAGSSRLTLSGLETLMAQADKQLCAQVRADKLGSFCRTPAGAPVRASSTPRNAPCPCGSGRKFKKCCGNPARETAKIAA